MENIRVINLNGKATLVVERLPHVRSMLTAVWIPYGSRHESSQDHGIAHCLEHMLFKGSSRRNAVEIAESMENVGGEINAFTSRENCCYYAKATVEHSGLIFDVLSDLVQRPQLSELELEKEKLVIQQEISSYQDNPEELVHDALVECMYGRALGHPVIGTKSSVSAMSTESIRAFFARAMQRPDMLISVVSSLSTNEVVKLANHYFEKTIAKGPPPKVSKANPRQSYRTIYKNVEQSHLNLGWHSLPLTHEDRYTQHLISSWLGGGMSSVLFQRIREQLGLAYSVYSYVRAYSDAGSIGIYSAHHPNSTSQILNEIQICLQELCSSGIRPQKLLQLKEQLKGSLLLGLENTSFRMQRMAIGMMYFDKVFRADELIDLVNQVTNDDVIRVAREIFSTRASIIQVGPLRKPEFEDSLARTQHV